MIKVVFRFVPGSEDDLQSKNDSAKDLQSNLDSKSDSGLKITERLSCAEIKTLIVGVLKENPSCTYETLSKMFSISKASVVNYLKNLSEAGVVRRVESDKDGHLEVLRVTVFLKAALFVWLWLFRFIFLFLWGMHSRCSGLLP